MYKSLLPFYNTLSIAKKLKFLSILSSMVSGVMVVSLVFIFQYLDEKEITVKESKIFANILADNIAPSIVVNDVFAISDILASVEYNDKIRQTFALDKSWKMLGAFHKGNNFTQQRNIIPIIKENQNLWKNGYFYSVVPIMSNESTVGNLVIVASLDDFYIRMIKNSFVIIAVFLLALFVTSRFMRILKKSILIPIAELDKITTEIIKTKNLKHDIPTFNNDEIGKLAYNFQEMLNELNLYNDELGAQKDILSYQANHDVLTNLPNRALFHDRLHQAINKSARGKEQFALLFIDLDKFKEVNDTYGHEYGDYLLKEVAKRFKSVLRENDTLARLGGDEFTVIMTNLKEYYFASVLAKKMIDILVQPIEVGEEQVVIGCSIGISLYPQDATETHELIKHADIAMYRSKAAGRNTYHFYAQEMTQEVMHRVNMQINIRRALEYKEFITYYQPQYDLRSNSIIGIEALVRWDDPTDGILTPSKFILLAEELGMVVGINHQVMRMSMLQAKEWKRQGLYFGRVSINISIEQLEDENFVDFVKKMLLETECEADYIRLELTESQIMKNPTVAIEVLNGLSAIGLELAIDDFGTGYSSLSYLKHFPINELKIDRSFIMDIPKDKDDAAIVDAIIALGKSLRLRIIAEGVETIEQKEFLASRGCYNIQGYLYSHPLAVEDMTNLLAQEKKTSLAL